MSVENPNVTSGESPFRYWIIENALPGQMAQGIFQELSAIRNTDSMYKYDNYFEKKYAEDRWLHLPPVTKSMLNWTLSGVFVKAIEEMTGLTGMIPDPHLTGGGIHIHKDGGILRPHRDFTLHKKLGLIRKLNWILYMNKNYDPAWGGQLELWSKDMSKCEVSIEPKFNRAVLFETPLAPHGFSNPWSAPHGITRKSLAVYLYAAPTIQDLQSDHKSTQFLKAPNEETTEYIEELRALRNTGRLASNV